MIDRRPSFGPDELPGSVGSPELAASLAMGRELEGLAGQPDAALGADFANRVMAAIALEPAPQPATVAGRALRAGSGGAFLAALRDAWRVALSGGRPLAVRAQAIALVLVAVLAIGSVLSAGAVGVAGALGLFRGDAPPPVAPVATPSPNVSPLPSTTPSPSPSDIPPVAPSPSPTDTDEPDETEEPEETEDPTDDSSGPGGGGSDNSGSGSENSGSGSDNSDSGSGSSGGGSGSSGSRSGSSGSRSGSSGSSSGGDDSPDDDSSGPGSGSDD